MLANGSVVCTLPDAATLRSIRFGVSMATDVVVRLRQLDPGYGFAMATDAGFAHERGFAERMPSPQPVPPCDDVLTATDGANEAIKLMVFHERHTAHQLLDVLPLLVGDDLSVTHMGADCVEVGPAGIDKGTGLAWLCAHLRRRCRATSWRSATSTTITRCCGGRDAASPWATRTSSPRSWPTR